MTRATMTALMKAEKAVEYVVRTRGRNSKEYIRTLHEYQVLVHRAVEHSGVQRTIAI